MPAPRRWRWGILSAGFPVPKTQGGVAVLPALFLAFLQRWHGGSVAFTYQDQAMNPESAHAMCEALDAVAAFAADTVLWGELASDPRLVQALRIAQKRVNQFLKEVPHV